MSAPTKYRKKPVVIEAMVWDGNVHIGHPVAAWIRANMGDYNWTAHTPQKLSINTLEGPITASPGDYIIRGVQGEFYPCKPDIFAATYERVAVHDPWDANCSKNGVGEPTREGARCAVCNPESQGSE